MREMSFRYKISRTSFKKVPTKLRCHEEIFPIHDVNFAGVVQDDLHTEICRNGGSDA